MTLTTPPIADEPNSRAPGPRSTSIRSAVSGLIATAWSTLVLDASRLPMPSVSTRTRSPWKPRSTGREALGPNEVAETPGWWARVSPIVGRRSRVSSSPLTTEVPDSMSSRLRRKPVTMMSCSSGACLESDCARRGACFGRIGLRFRGGRRLCEERGRARQAEPAGSKGRSNTGPSGKTWRRCNLL